MADPPSDLKTRLGHRHGGVGDRSADDLYGDTLGSGAVVGSWLIEEFRSRGGFASVYRGAHLQSGAPAAIKVLHRQLATSENVLRRFENEARTVALLNHPNIVKVEDVGQLTDGRPYYAMEWLDGRDLHDELAVRGAFALEDAAAVVRTLAGALAAAHAIGVVHRDLKTSNVMTVPAGSGLDVKLVDFGIAKLLDLDHPGRRSELTATGVRLGTPWVMAPEQILGRPVDARADIYALGVLLYQLLTGQFPFRAPSAVEVEELHLHAPVPRASAIAPVPAAVDELIARCMAKDPGDRHPSAEAVVAALERALGPAAPGETPAIGLYVEGVVGEEDADDDALFEALDTIMNAARRACAAAQMHIAVESGNAILAVKLLAGEPHAQRAARLSVLQAADQLRRELDGAAGRAPRVAFKIALARSPIAARRAGDEWTFVSGPLLALGAWAEPRPTGMLTADDGVLEDLGGACELESLPTPGVSRVVALR